MQLTDTIAAISTALSESAISIIRLSGTEAFNIAESVFSKSLKDKQSHTVHYGFIFDPSDQSIVDEVLVTIFKAPKTFTTEDIVEINCHGGVVITQRILSILLGQGARLANPGEFTQRAYLHGRIDLSQAESIVDLIQAPSIDSAALAISQVRGSIKKLIQPLLDELLSMIAHIEVNIDYPEYDDVIQLTKKDIYPRAKDWLQQLNEIISLSRSGQIVKEGVKTVILGKPNVGKSSILNALLEEEKAIVTDVAGTTRDLVEGWIRLKNVTLHLIDTAGLRETEDKVERIGIEKSKKALEEADLAIVVLDASAQKDDQDDYLLEITEGKQRIIVYNKSDVSDKEYPLQISALNQDIEPLILTIEQMFAHHQIALSQPTLSNQRQIGCAISAFQSMKSAIEAIEYDMEVDLITIDLQSAYQSLQNILQTEGETSLIDAIFSRFCLGK